MQLSVSRNAPRDPLSSAGAGSIGGGAKRGNPSTRLRRSLVEGDDHLIGADKAEVLAHQLVGHVRIGLARVEKRRMMAQLRALCLELREFNLALLQRAMVPSPGEDPVGPGDRVAGEGPDDDQRQRRRSRAANELKNAVPTPHDVTRRITMESRRQVKRMI